MGQVVSIWTKQKKPKPETIASVSENKTLEDVMKENEEASKKVKTNRQHYNRKVVRAERLR